MDTLDKMPQRDPTILAVAYKKQRIYLLSKREPQVVSFEDQQNKAGGKKL